MSSNDTNSHDDAENDDKDQHDAISRRIHIRPRTFEPRPNTRHIQPTDVSRKKARMFPSSTNIHPPTRSGTQVRRRMEAEAVAAWAYLSRRKWARSLKMSMRDSSCSAIRPPIEAASARTWSAIDASRRWLCRVFVPSRFFRSCRHADSMLSPLVTRSWMSRISVHGWTRAALASADSRECPARTRRWTCFSDDVRSPSPVRG